MNHNNPDTIVTLTGEVIPRNPVAPSTQVPLTVQEESTGIVEQTPVASEITRIETMSRNGTMAHSSAQPCANANEEWDVNEALRESRENAMGSQPEALQAARYRNNFHTHKNFRRNNRNWFNSHHPIEKDEEEVPDEQWDNLQDKLKDLANLLKHEKDVKSTDTDPVKIYQQKVEREDTVKIYSKHVFGFRILQKNRTEEEQLLIERSNYEMLSFIYSRVPEVINLGKANMNWTNLGNTLWNSIDGLANKYLVTDFRNGALSVAVDFEELVPRLIWRTVNGKRVYLRSVIIDGVAVLHATLPYNETFRPFSRFGRETPIYHEQLNLPVKAIFDIIMNFLIRGHKTEVFLPIYYKEYITPGGISKVDDIFAFQRLIELNFIKFSDIDERSNWFNTLSTIVDQNGAVFVSSVLYRPRGPRTYQSPSERIITPCFLNTEDRLMIIDPKIRYRDPVTKKFKTISAEQVLHFEENKSIEEVNNEHFFILNQQLYIEDQIRSICHLCQLYPTKLFHKLSIVQLLALIVRVEANIEMPFMDIHTYLEFSDKFGPVSNMFGARVDSKLV